MAMMAPRVAMRLPLLKSLVWLDWAKWAAVPGSPTVEEDTLPLGNNTTHHWLTSLQLKETKVSSSFLSVSVSAQDGIVVLGKAHTHSAPSLTLPSKQCQ